MTTHQLEFSSPSNEEAQRLGEILAQSFNSSNADVEKYFNIIGLENFRVVRLGGQIVAGLALYHMGQWFCGCSIPMTGIAAVGVAPEHRGTGVAAFLMAQTLKELHAKGVPISALYPATQRLYRQVGYEQGGNYCKLAIPIRSIALKGIASFKEIRRQTPVRRVELSNCEFQELYLKRAIAHANGNLNRNRAIWQQITTAPEEVRYAYLIGEDPEGYIIFSQQQDGKKFNLTVWDLVYLTPAAANRIWTFFADHSTQIEEVQWHSSLTDPMISLLAEQTCRIVSLERWLLRIVDVTKALLKRGYPTNVEAELHLEVRDNLLSENNGNYILKVSGGRGEVSKGGRGELKLDVRGLAPLYTSLFTPQQLQITGQIEATESVLSVAAQVFAGAEPWMSDFF